MRLRRRRAGRHTTTTHFVTALALLGIGWALMFTGGNALLTRQYAEHEKGTAQGVHDMLMFASMVACCSPAAP